MHGTFFDFLQGIVVGFAISLPLGPVALIIIKRTAEFGLRAGIISGLAIVILDTTFSIAILLGFHHSLPYLQPLPIWAHIIGASIIFLYGLRMVYTDPVNTIDKELPWHRHFFGSTLIALTNPTTYISFAVIGLLLTRFINESLFARMTIGVGFLVGALAWWGILIAVAFSQRDRYKNVRNINKIIGLVIMLLSILMLIPINSYHHHIRLFGLI